MKKILLSVLFLFLTAIIITIISVILIYRFPAGKGIIYKREVAYHMVDLGFLSSKQSFKDAFREQVFEPVFGYDKVYFSGNKGAEDDFFYMSKKDYKLCWPESPLDMDDKGYTVEATMEVKKLLSGGYAPPRVIMIVKKKGKPQISK